MEAGPVKLRGKVIERNSSGVAVEFHVGKEHTYKTVIPVDAAPDGDVGAAVIVAGELLSIVDTTGSPEGGLSAAVGDVVAHVKVAGVDFYVSPNALVAEKAAEPGPTAEPPADPPPAPAPEPAPVRATAETRSTPRRGH